MPAPESQPGVPPGLEYLTQIDQLLVNQQIELLESMSVLVKTPTYMHMIMILRSGWVTMGVILIRVYNV